MKKRKEKNKKSRKVYKINKIIQQFMIDLNWKDNIKIN